MPNKNDVDFGKNEKYIRALGAPPFYAINMNMVGNRWWPTPCMSLGGLQVDGATGSVLRGEGESIPGLYAAGRSAVGIVSNHYVSGLSLADAVFSGRKAGRSLAARRSKL